MIYLLDTSAVLIHYRQEPGYERIPSMFDDPSNGVLLSSVSLAEFGRVLRSAGTDCTVADDRPCSTGEKSTDTRGFHRRAIGRTSIFFLIGSGNRSLSLITVSGSQTWHRRPFVDDLQS